MENLDTRIEATENGLELVEPMVMSYLDGEPLGERTKADAVKLMRKLGYDPVLLELSGNAKFTLQTGKILKFTLQQ